MFRLITYIEIFLKIFTQIQVQQFNVCLLYGEQIWRIHMIYQTCILSVPQWNKSVLPPNLEIKVCVWKKNKQLHTFLEFMKVSAYKKTV
jgi:hypothetical protein